MERLANLEQQMLIKRLEEANLSARRFLKVDDTKRAFEKEWQNNLYTPEELEEQNYYRWGICGGDGLVLIDADSENMADILRRVLPQTFESLSSRRKLPHFYYKVDGPVENKTLYLPETKTASGEIRVNNQYLVAPGTKTFYGVYTVIADRPIAALTFEAFMAAVTPFLGKNQSQKLTEEQIRNGVNEGERHTVGIRYVNFLIGVQGLDYQTALIEMLRWNQTCRPPNDEAEIERMVRDALSYQKTQPKQDTVVLSHINEIGKQILGKDVFLKLLKTLSHTVKRDHYAKQLDLLHISSAYCNPINELKDAPTSEGKTYPTVQAVKFFPHEDVMLLGGLSPTALAHSHGELVDETSNLLAPKIKELNEKIEGLEIEAIGLKGKEKASTRIEQSRLKKELASIYRTANIKVNLENKIIVFLENPHPETWARLRPIMSHDKWRITYKFTDRVGAKGPLKQVTVIIEGWPVFIAFKAEGKNPEIWNQILSRGTNVPVEMSKTKYRAGVSLEALRRGLPQPIVNRKLHKDQVERAQLIVKAVKKRLLEIKAKIREQTGMDEVPNMFWIPYYRKIGAGFPAEIGMHMRESQRFLTVIQMHAAINVYARPILELDGAEYIICTLDDYGKACKLFFSDDAKSVIFSKLPKNKVDFFEKVLLPLWKAKRTATEDITGITTEEMRKKYFEAFNKPISSNTINYHYLRVLEDMNFISRSPDPGNKVRKLTVVLTESVSSEKSPIETHFKNGDVLSLEELKEAYSKDIQLMCNNPPQISIKNYTGEKLTLSELYAKFFCSRRGSLHINTKTEETTPSEEKELEETPKTETGVNGCISKEASNKGKFLHSPTIQETLNLLRKSWNVGAYSNFDSKVMRLRGCGPEEAEQLREKWEDEELLAYDNFGLLCWVNGSRRVSSSIKEPLLCR